MSSWKLQPPWPLPQGGGICSPDLAVVGGVDVQERKGSRGRTHSEECSPPTHCPGPLLATQCCWQEDGEPRAHSPRSHLQLTPWTPTWAPLGTKPGAGRSTLPPLGQARAGGAGCPPSPPWWPAGGRLAPGLGALSSWVPSTALRARSGGRARKAEVSSPPPLPRLPSLLPTRLLFQPPTSFCSFLWQPGNAA